MRQLNLQEIQKLNNLNNKLQIIEKRIYDIALQENQTALEKILKNKNNILDYELEVRYLIYEDDEHILADWTDNIKPIMMKEEWWGVNDKNCHNTTSVWQKNKTLNSQKHCWLLHNLYDHFDLTWDNIFNPNNSIPN